ncbi:DUF4365 domain-containing protein [Peristeroidobacter soli]|uniref:DUF4365 domain-containing protein n=1 Tax=Peristeroidobacter soli TaxID=2497877 RepID=UPI00101C4061|nr:DUF4365 domain-containing protein [Peristeroidobacter soli]
MKRPRQHVMEDASGRLFASLLPGEWIVRTIPKDYGVDYEIELVDQGIVLGDRIWVQLKSTERTKRVVARWPIANRFPDLRSDGDGNITAEYIPYSLGMKEIAYVQRCHFPLLLVVVDLAAEDAYWLPIRDEVDLHHSDLNDRVPRRKSATLRIPLWNSLTEERKRNYSGLRWYALEPGRMYAFATLHHFFHEFQYEGRLSGYSIGDGHIDDGAEVELKRSLAIAREYCEEALKLDVLFGERGIDFFRADQIPVVNAPGLKWQLEHGARAAKKALHALDSNEYTFAGMSILLGRVQQAINLMSTAVSAYQGFKGRFLLTEQTVVWHHWSVQNGRINLQQQR